MSLMPGAVMYQKNTNIFSHGGKFRNVSSKCRCINHLSIK